MAESLVSSLRKLARDKRGLREKERAVARVERRLVDYLGRALAGAGYCLLPVETLTARPTTANHGARVKRLRCPKCDRRFAHRLPLARHMSATHGPKKLVGKTKAQTAKK